MGLGGALRHCCRSRTCLASGPRTTWRDPAWSPPLAALRESLLCLSRCFFTKRSLRGRGGF